MPRYIAFLRAINVGGHVVKMEDLRAIFAAMKFKGVETFIASGNVIFETAAKPVAELETKIETALKKSLGYEVVTLLRTDAELQQISQYQPFPDTEAATTFCVGFLKKPLDAPQVKQLMALRNGDDDLHVHGSEVYWLSRLKQSESKFSNGLLEKSLKLRCTFRGMSTVRKLAAKYPPR